MKLTGLKFLLSHGMFVSAIIAEEEAKHIIQQWMSGYYRVKDISMIGSVQPPPGGWLWAVKISDISAIHTFAPEELPQFQKAFSTHAVATPWGRSGL